MDDSGMDGDVVKPLSLGELCAGEAVWDACQACAGHACAFDAFFHLCQQALKEGLEECVFASAALFSTGGAGCTDIGLVVLGADGLIT